MSLTSLPPEIFMAIANSIPERGFWCTLASLCKATNQAVTPLLYADISFKPHHAEQATQCCRVLAKNGHLARLVRSFYLNYLDAWVFPSRDDVLRSREFKVFFPQSLARMTSLRHLYYAEIIGFTGTALQAIHNASASLESLVVRITEPTSAEEVARLEQQVAGPISDSHFPRLTKVHILGRWLSHPLLVKRLRHIFASNSKNIRDIAFPYLEVETSIAACFQPELTWPRLDRLEISWSMIPHVPAEATQDIRRLALHTGLHARNFGTEDEPTHVLEPAICPNLERLWCHYSLLPKVLPSNPCSPRPIDTLVVVGMRRSDDIKTCLPYLINSARPVTCLTMLLLRLDFCEVDLAQFASTLAALTYLKLEVGAEISNVSYVFNPALLQRVDM